ncbi:MAG: hypothetical protein QOE06_2135 [Thermoleophilaceae bacterium]|nr:hypothetical protein [Thermoleophilaceae bacterium]
MASGMCLMVGPALTLAASIVDPSDGDGKKYLQSLKDDPDGAQLSTALWIVGFTLMAIGITGLVHVIRDRGVTLANIGGGLGIIGSILFVALVSTTLQDLNAAEHLPIDTAKKLNDGLDDYWTAYIVFIPALFGTFVGFIVLGAAIIRSKVVHLASGVMLILAMLALFSSDGGTTAASIAGGALLTGGFGMAGLRILGMTDDQWDGRAPLTAGPPPAA